MRQAQQLDEDAAVWGPYPNYDDIARYRYGRLLWQREDARQRLLAHWLHPEHPHRERFQEHRALVEELFESDLTLTELDRRFRERGTSLRCVVREILPVFGSFF